MTVPSSLSIWMLTFNGYVGLVGASGIQLARDTDHATELFCTPNLALSNGDLARLMVAGEYGYSEVVKVLKDGKISFRSHHYDLAGISHRLPVSPAAARHCFSRLFPHNRSRKAVRLFADDRIACAWSGAQEPHPMLFVRDRGKPAVLVRLDGTLNELSIGPSCIAVRCGGQTFGYRTKAERSSSGQRSQVIRFGGG